MKGVLADENSVKVCVSSKIWEQILITSTSLSKYSDFLVNGIHPLPKQ